MFLRLFHAVPSYLGPAALWPKAHPAQNSNREPPTVTVFFMFCLPLIPVSPSLFEGTIERVLQRYTAARPCARLGEVQETWPGTLEYAPRPARPSPLPDPLSDD